MQLEQGRQLLRERIAEIDEISGDTGTTWESLAAIMSTFTSNYYSDGDVGFLVHPDDADAIVARSKTLRTLASENAGIINGPVDITSQVWVETGDFHKAQRIPGGPQRQLFTQPNLHSSFQSRHDFGLHTSSIVHNGVSMWYMYLEPYTRSNLFPRPWQSWKMHLNDAQHLQDPRILEVNSAAAWVQLVDRHAEAVKDGAFPDWHRLLDEYDGIHLAMSAIVAIQGLYIGRPGEIIAAPTYWDVETTLWLNWVFTSATAAPPSQI